MFPLMAGKASTLPAINRWLRIGSEAGFGGGRAELGHRSGPASGELPGAHRLDAAAFKRICARVLGASKPRKAQRGPERLGSLINRLAVACNQCLRETSVDEIRCPN